MVFSFLFSFKINDKTTVKERFFKLSEKRSSRNRFLIITLHAQSLLFSLEEDDHCLESFYAAEVFQTVELGSRKI